MSENPDVARARQMIEEQIAALGSLRNGSTRDSNFKQWRQNTLTVIQRCWPGEPQRGERFRRVPFSAPSSRADAREMREYFERGCAEALGYLRSLLAEIDKAGLPRASAESRPAPPGRARARRADRRWESRPPPRPDRGSRGATRRSRAAGPPCRPRRAASAGSSAPRRSRARSTRASRGRRRARTARRTARGGSARRAAARPASSAGSR